MNQLRTKAIILRRTNYGEADRILQLLTPDHGVLSAIAKGIRREKSKLAGGLELFATCDVTIIQGRGELGLVSSARLQHFYGDGILHDYDRMQFAYRCTKLVSQAASGLVEPAFYELLEGAYQYLETPLIDWRLTEVWFRLHLAQLLGRGLNLRFDTGGQPLQEGAQYQFDATDMSFALSPRGEFDAAAIKFLRLASVKKPDVLAHIGGLEQLLDRCVWLARLISE